jgi:endonuclease/exonuclease/phosphatase (EEP) superfamily protein YafD
VSITELSIATAGNNFGEFESQLSMSEQFIKCCIDRLFRLITVTVTVLSLTGYLGEWQRYLEATSHFKVQYLLAGLCAFFFFGMNRRKLLWLAVSAFCILLNLAEIVPWYMPPHVNAGESSEQVRIFLFSVDRPSDGRYSEVRALVRKENPDVAIFPEASDTWAKELKALQDILPYSASHHYPTDGIAIYSKLPLANVGVKFWGDRKVVRTLVADVTLEDRVVSMVATHLFSPRNETRFEWRNRHLEEIGDYAIQSKNPILVVGDLNMTVWSPYYKRFAQKTGLRNARSGFGILPTWRSNRVPFVSLPIDHFLVSPEIKVVKIRTAGDMGSAHLPVIADVMIPRK